jgi:hypothetical protein
VRGDVWHIEVEFLCFLNESSFIRGPSCCYTIVLLHCYTLMAAVTLLSHRSDPPVFKRMISLPEDLPALGGGLRPEDFTRCVLHCRFTVSLRFHGCYTIVTVLLHCCHTVITLLPRSLCFPCSRGVLRPEDFTR